MNVINVLYLDHSNDFSGGQVSLLALLKALDRDRVNPLVGINPSAANMKKELERASIPFVELNFQKVSVYSPWAFISFIFRLKSIVKEYRIDLIHTNTFMTGLMLAVIKELINVPFIFRARLAIEFHGHGLIDKIIYHRSDLILANSHYVKQTFESKFGKSAAIKTIYNPMDVQAVQYEPRQSASFTFAIFGRIEPIKRHHDIVSAVEILASKGLRFSVWIFGAPSKEDKEKYYSHLRDRIAQRNLEQYFEWKGFVSNPMRFASNVDACISCTLGEALSRSVFECQLNNIPVIASRSGGNIEIIKDRETGFLFNPGDPIDLAKHMEILMHCNRAEISAITDKAKSQAIQLFSFDSTVKKEVESYWQLIKSKGD